jgi:hypothetical protein
VKTRFEATNLVLEILYDDFQGTIDTASTYDSYGNKGIKSNEEFTVTGEYDHDFNGLNGHVLLYERSKLSGLEEDRNYYATISFARTSKEVVTVFIKSIVPIYIDYVMPSFEFTPKAGDMPIGKVFEPVNKEFDEKTQAFYENYFEYNEKVDFGIFEPTYPMEQSKLHILENLFSYDFPITLLYNSFQLPFKTEYMNNAKQDGKIVEYTLYTMDKIDGKEKDITLDVLDGKYDDYLDDLAYEFNQYDYPILFRLNNEMNGAWDPYSAFFNGKDTDLYVECWRYIYDKFEEDGVDNLIFVWNPNELSFPNYAYNNYMCYYPGNEYVDVVGMTSYNTGSYYNGETWRSFSQAYDHIYDDYTERFKHPMMITEFSCASMGGDKAAWFDDMFETINNYPRIKLAVLWNGQDLDHSKEVKTVSRDYRIDLNDLVIKSIRTNLQKYK